MKPLVSSVLRLAAIYIGAFHQAGIQAMAEEYRSSGVGGKIQKALKSLGGKLLSPLAAIVYADFAAQTAREAEEEYVAAVEKVERLLGEHRPTTRTDLFFGAALGTALILGTSAFMILEQIGKKLLDEFVKTFDVSRDSYEEDPNHLSILDRFRSWIDNHLKTIEMKLVGDPDSERDIGN